MKFIDVAEIQVKSGDGGAGMAHFRREKFLPFGGPDGGNGGDGGSVILEGDSQMTTLLDFRYQRQHEAEDGGKGGTNNRAGKRGTNKILRVPLGTVAVDAETGEVIGEVLRHEQQLRIAEGGKGGIGNKVFASSRNQAPTKTVPPGSGVRRTIRLELKMIADVGIVGAPNAGKSTLITVVSAAQPKVADYPFTTLVPNLGVVAHREREPFVVADVPGLIPGASEGKGLGHEFLRHVERTRVLVHLIDSSFGEQAILENYEAILHELRNYKPELLERPRVTVLSKAEVSENDPELREGRERAVKVLKKKGEKVMILSSALRTGISELLDQIVLLLDKEAEFERSMEDIFTIED